MTQKLLTIIRFFLRAIAPFTGILTPFKDDLITKKPDIGNMRRADEEEEEEADEEEEA